VILCSCDLVARGRGRVCVIGLEEIDLARCIRRATRTMPALLLNSTNAIGAGGAALATAWRLVSRARIFPRGTEVREACARRRCVVVGRVSVFFARER